MGRSKVKLELIAKERNRNTTFQKRKNGLKKKTYEISILCDVDACLIIFAPKQGDRFVVQETWPEDRDDVLNLIEKFRKHNTDRGLGKRHISLGVPDVIRERTKKLNSELAKVRQRNNMVKYPTWDERFNYFSEEQQLKSLYASLDSKLEIIKLKIDLLEGNFYLDDLMGFIGSEEYSVVPPSLNQNPPPPPYMDNMHIHHHHQGNLYIMDDDVTGLIDSSVLPLSLNQNPSPLLPAYMDMHHQYQYQPLSYLRPVADPSLVFPMTTTTVIGGTGNCYGAPMSNPIYYNTMLPPFDEMAGGGVAQLPCDFSPNIQPLMPFYFAPQLHHQINELSDLQDYRFNTNGVVDDDSSLFHAHLDDHQWP